MEECLQQEQEGTEGSRIGKEVNTGAASGKAYGPGSCLTPLEPRRAVSYTSEAAWTCIKEAQTPSGPSVTD